MVHWWAGLGTGRRRLVRHVQGVIDKVWPPEPRGTRGNGVKLTAANHSSSRGGAGAVNHRSARRYSVGRSGQAWMVRWSDWLATRYGWVPYSLKQTNSVHSLTESTQGDDRLNAAIEQASSTYQFGRVQPSDAGYQGKNWTPVSPGIGGGAVRLAGESGPSARTPPSLNERLRTQGWSSRNENRADWRPKVIMADPAGASPSGRPPADWIFSSLAAAARKDNTS